MDKEQLLYHYFSNSLSSEQDKQLEELLETDAEFREQFQFEKDLKRVVRESEKGKLKSKLGTFEAEIAQEKPVIQLGRDRKKGRFNWSIAASIAILFGLGWLGYTTFSGTDYQDLYQENFEEYPNTVYTITRGDTQESIERTAFAAYESKDYKTAIGHFKKLDNADDRPYLDFYLGQSHLNLGNTDDAIAYFKRVVAERKTFEAESHWYLALAYLQQKDAESSIQQLEVLTSKYDYNKVKALALLKELD